MNCHDQQFMSKWTLKTVSSQGVVKANQSRNREQMKDVVSSLILACGIIGTVMQRAKAKSRFSPPYIN